MHEAFAQLLEGAVEELLKSENRDTLIAVLTYYVIPGKVMSDDIAGQQLEVATVQSANVSINAQNGVMVNDAKVVSADIEASKGVLHFIDKAIMPPAYKL